LLSRREDASARGYASAIRLVSACPLLLEVYSPYLELYVANFRLFCALRIAGAMMHAFFTAEASHIPNSSARLKLAFIENLRRPLFFVFGALLKDTPI